MTNIILSTENLYPRSGDISKSYPRYIHTHESPMQEKLDYFSAPFELVSRIGVTALICTSLGSGAMHGLTLTEDGLREALRRNRASLIHHSVGNKDRATKSEEVESRTLTEQLRDIRKAFGLNASDLATLIGVSRPTLYTWLDGQAPKSAEAVEHIFSLSKVADDFASLGLRRPDNLVKRPMFENGASLFGLLQQGKDIHNRFEALRTLDEKEATSRGKIRGSDKSIISLDEAASESVPAYSE